MTETMTNEDRADVLCALLPVPFHGEPELRAIFQPVALKHLNAACEQAVAAAVKAERERVLETIKLILIREIEDMKDYEKDSFTRNFPNNYTLNELIKWIDEQWSYLCGMPSYMYHCEMKAVEIAKEIKQAIENE